MKKNILIILICFTLILLSFSLVYALPNLQVYIPGSTAGNVGGDEQTWVYAGPGNNIPLNVVVSFSNNYSSVSNITLVATVPQTQDGSISIAGLSAQGQGYETRSEFLPAKFNNHYPFGKDDQFNYIVFDLGLGTIDKSSTKTPLPNYDASTGTITYDEAFGELFNFSADISGFDYVHFDVYADFNNSDKGWEINPGSHDSSTVVPEPATIFLMGSGLLGVGIVLRKKLLKPKNK